MTGILLLVVLCKCISLIMHKKNTHMYVCISIYMASLNQEDGQREEASAEFWPHFVETAKVLGPKGFRFGRCNCAQAEDVCKFFQIVTVPHLYLFRFGENPFHLVFFFPQKV